MTNLTYEQLVEQMFVLITSMFGDIAAGRERFTPVKVTFGRDLFRTGYDSAKLAETPISEVRSALLRILGQRAFDRLLHATDDERHAMAVEAVQTEADGCAVEFASQDLMMFRIRLSHALPQPLLHLVLWIVRQIYLDEFSTGIRLFLEDLASDGTEWAVSAPHFAGSLESIREIGPLAAGATPPARVREWMRAAVGAIGLARLDHLSAAERDDLRSHVDASLHYSRSQPRGLRPAPPPDIPPLAVFTAQWGLEALSVHDISNFLSVVLAEVSQRGKGWSSEALALDPDSFWLARQYSEQLRLCTPRDTHDWLACRLGAARVQKLCALSNDEHLSLARELLRSKQDELDPPSWRPASPPRPVDPGIPVFVCLAADWVSRFPGK